MATICCEIPRVARREGSIFHKNIKVFEYSIYALRPTFSQNEQAFIEKITRIN